ncbi:MAG: DUF4252 domain-containing protein [Acidobacteria bacterium]|nr:DUF4252 domain-containing protein [Acidobacteriota bacterium]
MKTLIKHSMKLLFLIPVAVMVTTAFAQDPKLHFERLSSLETKARDVVEVNIDGKLLDLAKRVISKVSDEDAKKVAQAIAGLKGIYVRAYNFENENEYNAADVDSIRAELSSPGWEKLANVRSKKNNQKVDVFTMFEGQNMSGVAVVISDNKSVALVNVVGPIDIDLLVELSGKLNIPKIDIDTGTKKDKE